MRRLITCSTAHPKITKLGQVGAWPRSRDILLNLGIPSISGKGIVRDFKFGAQIGRQAYKSNKKCKSKSEGAWPRSTDLIVLIS